MALNELLSELNTLTHAGRMRRMVELGRRASEPSDSEARASIATMEGGDFYQRWLALQSCFGSRDGAHALRALEDPSRLIRRRALVLIALCADDSAILATLDALPREDQRRTLASLLRKRKRLAPIDAYLEKLAERDDPSLICFLAYGSPLLIERYIERAQPGADQGDMRHLAHRHPKATATILRQRAEEADRLDTRLVWQASAALPELAVGNPEAALALVQALLRHAPLTWLDMKRLAQQRPRAFADLALETESQPKVSLDKLVERLAPEQLTRLVEHGLLGQPERWLRHIPPAHRAAVYAAGAHGWRDADGCLAPGIVALLPRGLRGEEARRHLALPVLATRPSQCLPYAAYLPWDEMRAALDPYLGHPDADLRGIALAASIGAARYAGAHLDDVIALVHSRRNEQDPVRLAMLTALAALPSGRWQDQHLDGLGQIFRDALDAIDVSPATLSAATTLIVALLPFHPAWSASWLATFVRERGQVGIGNLSGRLSDADVRRIAPDLLPVLQSWETHEHEAALIGAAANFGLRLRVFDELVDVLEHLLRNTRQPWFASRILSLLAEHRYERFAALVPALLTEDQSWFTQLPVAEYLHRQRQDLLTPYLGQTRYTGRFATGRVRYVPPFTNGFMRWTPEQQHIFADVVVQVARDEKRDTFTLRIALAQLAALPAIPATHLLTLAQSDKTKPAVRERALRLLGRLDAGDGLPLLLEALGDDRARIAIYALRTALRDLPAPRALDVLRAVSLERVTVAKEVVRLLGDLPGDAGYDDLLALDGRDLHRDVRVALLRAFWEHLERDETWPILERAAVATDPAIAGGVVRIPTDRLSATASRRLAKLLALLLSHPDAPLRVSVLERCATLPVPDTERALQPPILVALASSLPDEHTAAARALFTTYSGRDAAIVGRAIERVRGQRRNLMAALKALQVAVTGDRGHLLETARAALADLESDPLTAPKRIDLAVRALPWQELPPLLERMAAAGELHIETIGTAIAAISRPHGDIGQAEIDALESVLAHHADERFRRLGLAALVASAKTPRGWDEERIQRLRAYRDDPSPLVAGAAQFTFPPVE